MLDTVWLNVQDFDLRDAKLLLQPAKLDMKKGVLLNNHALWHNGEEYVMGESASHQGDGWHVKVVNPPRIKNDGSDPLLLCNFEVAKLTTTGNYHIATRENFSDGMNFLQKEFEKLGIACNVKAARIGRADLCQNLMVDEAPIDYQRVFGTVKCKRSVSREEPHGWLFYNGSTEFSAYDKRQQLIDKKRDLTGVPDRVLRLETRMKKPKVVARVLGMETPYDVLEDFGRLKEVYNKCMKENLFKYNPTEFKALLADDIKADMTYFKANFGRNWMQLYFSTYGMFTLMRISSMEVLMDAVKSTADNRMQESRVENSLQKLKMNTEFMTRFSTSEKTTGDLYRELKRKALA
jgi:hypothetical protein